MQSKLVPSLNFHWHVSPLMFRPACNIKAVCSYSLSVSCVFSFFQLRKVVKSLLELSEDFVLNVKRSVEYDLSSSWAPFLIYYSAIKFSSVQKRFWKALTYNSVKHPEEWVLALEGQNVCISLGG